MGEGCGNICDCVDGTWVTAVKAMQVIVYGAIAGNESDFGEARLLSK
jgi:hypothetical protein